VFRFTCNVKEATRLLTTFKNMTLTLQRYAAIRCRVSASGCTSNSALISSD
jgi:hypothetical protein